MHKTVFLCCLLLSAFCQAQSFKFDFTTNKSVKNGAIKITPQNLYNDNIGYGYDLQPAPAAIAKAPFFFSVKVPDGNYKITVTLGNKKQKALRLYEPNRAVCFLKI